MTLNTSTALGQPAPEAPPAGMPGSADQLVEGLWLGCQNFEGGALADLAVRNIRAIVQAGMVR